MNTQIQSFRMIARDPWRFLYICWFYTWKCLALLGLGVAVVIARRQHKVAEPEGIVSLFLVGAVFAGLMQFELSDLIGKLEPWWPLRTRQRVFFLVAPLAILGAGIAMLQLFPVHGVLLVLTCTFLCWLRLRAAGP